MNKYIMILILTISFSCGDNDGEQKKGQDSYIYSITKNSTPCPECFYMEYNDNILRISLQNSNCTGDVVYKADQKFIKNENNQYILEKLNGADCFPFYNEIIIENNNTLLYQGDSYEINI